MIIRTTPHGEENRGINLLTPLMVDYALSLSLSLSSSLSFSLSEIYAEPPLDGNHLTKYIYILNTARWRSPHLR